MGGFRGCFSLFLETFFRRGFSGHLPAKAATSRQKRSCNVNDRNNRCSSLSGLGLFFLRNPPKPSSPEGAVGAEHPQIVTVRRSAGLSLSKRPTARLEKERPLERILWPLRLRLPQYCRHRPPYCHQGAFTQPSNTPLYPYMSRRRFRDTLPFYLGLYWLSGAYKTTTECFSKLYIPCPLSGPYPTPSLRHTKLAESTSRPARSAPLSSPQAAGYPVLPAWSLVVPFSRRGGPPYRDGLTRARQPQYHAHTPRLLSAPRVFHTARHPTPAALSVVVVTLFGSP